jgi:dipeptidyl aminopeptidase/acylaminoacyl peptidase
VTRTIGGRYRRLLAALLALLLVAVALTATAVVGNDFALDERQVRIPTAAGELDGVLALPEGGDAPAGVVLFVHGDGPVDATSDGMYRPIWEDIARAGYASLSWSKPGVGASAGDWLDQSMADRAAEVGDVLDWVHQQPDLARARTGLWGASQGGWVVPAVAAHRDDVAFTILVSPAVSWLRQGRFHLLAGLDDAEATPAERAAAIASSGRTRDLLREHASYERYRRETDDPEPMDRDRWGFVLRNFRADATEDLRAMAARRIPTLLVLADGDRNVDTDETERTYRAVLGDELRVRRFAGARHSLARAAVEDHEALGLLTAVVAPRRVFVPGYTAAHREFLTDLSGAAAAD